MDGAQEALIVFGSPVISPKAPRKILAPSVNVKFREESYRRSAPPSQASSVGDVFKSFPLSKTSQIRAGGRTTSPSVGRGSPVRRGRSILSDGGRRGRSPVEWEGQQHWSEVIPVDISAYVEGTHGFAATLV